MTDLINQLMNHEAVYRTAPATPGLLIIYINLFDWFRSFDDVVWRVNNEVDYENQLSWLGISICCT